LLVYDADTTTETADVRLIDFTNATLPSMPLPDEAYKCHGIEQEGPDAGAILGVRTLRAQLALALKLGPNVGHVA